MTTLAARGIQVHLPRGFEGRIFQRLATSPGATSETVVHLATFALPAGTADFGGGATPLMGPSDIFAVLFEYGQESVGRALFRRGGMPRSLAPASFSRHTLRRGLPEQAGTQWFFTESGRPFALYVVVGSYARRAVLAPQVDTLLGGITIAAKPTPKAA